MGNGLLDYRANGLGLGLVRVRLKPVSPMHY